jgi:hypothetical protein
MTSKNGEQSSKHGKKHVIESAKQCEEFSKSGANNAIYIICTPKKMVI